MFVVSCIDPLAAANSRTLRYKTLRTTSYGDPFPKKNSRFFIRSARNTSDAFHRYQVKPPRSPVRLPYRETFSDVTITALIAGSSSFAEWRVTGLNSRFHGIRVRSSFRGDPTFSHETARSPCPAALSAAIGRRGLPRRRYDSPDFR